MQSTKSSALGSAVGLLREPYMLQLHSDTASDSSGVTSGALDRVASKRRLTSLWVILILDSKKLIPFYLRLMIYEPR